MLNTILGSLSSGVAASTSSYESIATINATGTTATFTSIPSTYVSLQLRYLFADTGANTPYIRPNSDNTNVYASHEMNGDGATVYAQSSTGGGNGFINLWGTPTTANTFLVGTTDILDYANTSKFKTLRHFTGYDQNGNGSVCLTSTLWRSTAAISSIAIICPGNFASGSVLALYGLKGA